METATAATDSGRLNEKWLYVGAILFGAFLRIAGFWKPSLWLDELSTAWVASAGGWDVLRERSFLAHQPPTYFLIVKLFLALGRSEFFLRLPSILFGVASIGVFMMLMRRAAGARAALCAGAIYALNSKAIYHGQEARMYALLLLGTLASSYFFLAVVERAGKWNIAGYALATLLVCYTHLIYGTVLAAQIGAAACLYLLLPERRANVVRLLQTQPLLLVLALPLAPLFLSVVGGWRAGLGSFIELPAAKINTLRILLLETVLSILAVSVMAQRLWVRRRELGSWTVAERIILVLGVSYLAIFPITVLVAELNIINILEPRYLLVSLLGGIMVAALGFAKTDDPPLRIVFGSYVVGVGLLQATLALSTGPWVSLRHEDWRGAIRWLEQNYRPGDVVLLRSGLIEANYLSWSDPGAREYLALPFSGFYDRGGMTVFNLPRNSERLRDSPLFPEIAQQEAKLARRLYFLVSAPMNGPWNWDLVERWATNGERPLIQSERMTFQELEIRTYQSER
jgi:hypothetical protein